MKNFNPIWTFKILNSNINKSEIHIFYRQIIIKIFKLIIIIIMLKKHFILVLNVYFFLKKRKFLILFNKKPFRIFVQTKHWAVFEKFRSLEGRQTRPQFRRSPPLVILLLRWSPPPGWPRDPRNLGSIRYSSRSLPFSLSKLRSLVTIAASSISQFFGSRKRRPQSLKEEKPHENLKTTPESSPSGKGSLDSYLVRSPDSQRRLDLVKRNISLEIGLPSETAQKPVLRSCSSERTDGRVGEHGEQVLEKDVSVCESIAGGTSELKKFATDFLSLYCR